MEDRKDMEERGRRTFIDGMEWRIKERNGRKREGNVN
jgi:hypothetical protein